MHKQLTLLATMALALVACNKSQTIVTEAPGEISFKAVTSVATKADPEINTTVLPDNNYKIFVAATNAETNSQYFGETAFTTADATVTSESQYKAASPIYWPVGGANLDFLAYATTDANKTKLGTITWGTPATLFVQFAEWDTYENQVDLVYAKSNNTAKGASVKLDFKHAQALLSFEAKKSGTGTSGEIKINSITIQDLDYKVTYKIDNTYNELITSWTVSNHEDKIIKNIDAGGYVVTASSLHFGDNLLVPEQGRKNFIVNYTVSGNNMNYTYNSPRGKWEAGKKYVYKIDLNLTEIVFTEEVAAWDTTSPAGDINVPIN